VATPQRLMTSWCSSSSENSLKTPNISRSRGSSPRQAETPGGDVPASNQYGSDLLAGTHSRIL
jgi:hypothetical protein